MDASLDDFDLEGDYEAAGSRSQVGEPYMPHQVRICGKLGNLGNVQDGVITIECDEWQPLPDAPECHASHERQLQHHLQRAFDSSDARLQTYAKDSRHDHVRVSDFYGSNTGPILNEFVEYGLRDRDLRCDLGSGEIGESGVQLVREASQHSLAILGNAGLAAEDRMGEAEVGGLGAVLDGVFLD